VLLSNAQASINDTELVWVKDLLRVHTQQLFLGKYWNPCPRHYMVRALTKTC